MNIKFRKTNIDGTALKFYFANCLKICWLIFTKKHIFLGIIFKLVLKKVEVLVPSCNDFYIIFKWFCTIVLHKLILKLHFFGLGWAQVYRSQLGLITLNLVSCLNCTLSGINSNLTMTLFKIHFFWGGEGVFKIYI